jgi:hypothetical protein
VAGLGRSQVVGGARRSAMQRRVVGGGVAGVRKSHVGGGVASMGKSCVGGDARRSVV